MNRLKVNQQETILTLWRRGWSVRRIAREMGYDRETVGKYVRLEEAKPATPTPGSAKESETGKRSEAPSDGAKPATLATGSATGNESETPGPLSADGAISTTVFAGAGGDAGSKPATPSPGSMIADGAGGQPEFAGQHAESAAWSPGAERQQESAGTLAPTDGKATPVGPNPGQEKGKESVATLAPSGLEAKSATLIPGSEAGAEPKPTTPTAGKSEAADTNHAGELANGAEPFAQALAAARANVSLCEVWKKEIEAGLDRGLSAKRIHQELVGDHGFAGGYQSVKRFVRRLEEEAPVPYRRMEFAPGEQLQVDFGTGAWIAGEQDRRRRSYVFRAVLCCSRKGYSEATLDQKTETFLRCLENAFRHFGGVPVGTTPDNLKAAVLHPDWYDPEINPKLASFAAHYGTVILPTKPMMPRHKGRVERGVDFVQEALRGRCFASLAEENTFLSEWERNVADTRIHGTTRRHVGQHFIEVEKPALLPLPANIFPSFTEGKRSVHLDGHVEFDKAYYSVPPEYTGREVWVRGESRVIRIYTLKMELITIHVRTEPGLARTDDAHIHPLKRRLADRGTTYLLERCQSLGINVGAWAVAMHRHRGIESIRVLQGLIALARKTPAESLERAAAKALQRAGWKLGDLKQTLAEPENVVQIDFLETHPLIREMEAYRIPFSHE
jgi:transposase